MDDEVRFIGLAFDDDRPKVTPHDRQQLVSALAAQGFNVSQDDLDDTWLVWQPGFDARVALEADWMVQVTVDVRMVDVHRDAESARQGINFMASVIGVVTDVADNYLGFASKDVADDLSFVVEDPPVEITAPMAMVYLGRRYLDDWGVPDFAATAEFEVDLPAGRLIIPSLLDLG